VRISRPAVAMLARDPAAPGKTRLLDANNAAAQRLRRALLLDSLDAVAQAGRPVHVFLTPAGAEDAVRAVVADDPGLASQVERLTFEGQNHALEIYAAVMVVFFLISFPLTRLAAYLERRLV